MLRGKRKAEECPPSTSKKRENKKTFHLPVEGSVMDTSTGSPFYHRSIAKLTKAEMDKLKECGVHLSNAKFSDIEDRRIRKNWRRFARSHDLSLDDFTSLYGSGPQKTEAQWIMLKKLRQDGFWPEMCRKLDDRAAFQVYNRMCILFRKEDLQEDDPYREWTKTDENQLLQLHSAHGAEWVRIGKMMRRLPHHCQTRYKRLTSTFGLFRYSERKRMFDCIKTQLNKASLEEAVMVDDCDQIDWDEIAVQLNRDKSQCRRHWSFERDCILQELAQDEDEIHLGLPFKSRARREDWKTFLTAVLQQNPSTKDDIDYESAVQQMNKQSNHGLIGTDFIQHWRRKMLLFCNRNKSVIQDGQITFNEFLRNAVSVYEEPPMNPRRLKEKLRGRWLDEEVEDEDEA